MKTTRMPIADQVQSFSIWLAYIHFIDHPQTGKVRPVLVVGTKDNVIAVAKITSKPPLPNTFDVAIVQWQQAGLYVPSTVRCSQVFEVNPAELLRDAPVGNLRPFDIVRVTQTMTALGYFL